VKRSRGIKVEELIWHEYKRLFRKKYLSERYYDRKAKEFYELIIGSMINEAYTTNFLKLLWYVPNLKDEKTKVQRFINGFPLASKYWIEYDNPWSLEEFIRKLKQCYENFKCKSEPKKDWKGNYKTKGKWAKKRGMP